MTFRAPSSNPGVALVGVLSIAGAILMISILCGILGGAMVGPDRVTWKNSQEAIQRAAGDGAVVERDPNYLPFIIPGYFHGGKGFYITVDGESAVARCAGQIIGGTECSIKIRSP